MQKSHPKLGLKNGSCDCPWAGPYVVWRLHHNEVVERFVAKRKLRWFHVLSLPIWDWLVYTQRDQRLLVQYEYKEVLGLPRGPEHNYPPNSCCGREHLGRQLHFWWNYLLQRGLCFETALLFDWKRDLFQRSQKLLRKVSVWKCHFEIVFGWDAESSNWQQ